MNKVLLACLIIAFLSNCNSKNSKKISATPTTNQNNPEVISQKLNGDEIVEELEKIGFFSLTDVSELEEVKQDYKRSYDDLQFFEGKLRGESLEFMDNRFYFIDCEELFEANGFTEYLSQVKRSFDKLGLKLEFSNEQNELTDTYYKHSIVVNGSEFNNTDESVNRENWATAYVHFINVLNVTLIVQGSKEQFYPISCGNDGRFVLLSPEQFEFVIKHYPNDNEHPTTLSKWMSDNGI